MLKNLKKWILILLILGVLFAFFYFHLHDYLTFSKVKENREFLMTLTQTHYWLTVLCFMLVYIVAVACSFPGAIVLTVIGGFLFGIVPGTLYVIVSATLGSVLVFLAVKLVFRKWVQEKEGRMMKKLEKGFRENAVSYLF